MTTTVKQPTYTHKGERKEGRTFWRTVISLPAELPPFTITSKSSRYSPRTKMLAWRVKSVEQVDPGEATCIQVDSPDHLFLTEGCIPTHNSLAAASIAYVSQRTKSDAHFHIIDTEDRWEASIEGMDLHNYTLYPAWDHMTALAASQLATSRAQKGDWIVMDKAGDEWPFAQEHYHDEIDGLTKLEFVERQVKKGLRKWDVTREVAWEAVNPYHDSVIIPILRSPAHVFFTASAREVNMDGEKNKGVRVMWGKVGVKPECQWRLPFRVDTVLLTENPIHGKFTLTTIAETGINREWLKGAEIPKDYGFVTVYLLTNGWSLS